MLVFSCNGKEFKTSLNQTLKCFIEDRTKILCMDLFFISPIGKAIYSRH